MLFQAVNATVHKMFGFGPQIAKLLRHEETNGISTPTTTIDIPLEIEETAQDISLLEVDTTSDDGQIFDLLDRADGTRDGRIDTRSLLKWVTAMDLKKAIDMEANLNITPTRLERLVSRADANKDGFVDKEEFSQMLRDHAQELDKAQRSLFRQYLKVIAYGEEITLCPPPIFILSVAILEVIVFISHMVQFHKHHPELPVAWNEIAPLCSKLILNPNQRAQVWRFLTYSLVHSGFQHFALNVVMQILVGLPLEMTHGPYRVGTVYLVGVLAGSLGSSIFEPHAFLAGASGGVYALIGAHLATLILNWREDIMIINKRVRRGKATSAKHGHMIRTLRLILVLAYAVVDPVIAIIKHNGKTSYVAHLSGALIGVLIGIVVLKNRKVEHWEQKLKTVCLALVMVIMVPVLSWNIFADFIVRLVHGNNATYFGVEPGHEFLRSCHNYI
ncbi:hypothetical protein TCAL_04481 [Tigriopus californicus]|uniref:EF-hand domain-containing protein n=1 Tax=Tigriopus californicus TaxID=6832 RepID=A0A553NZH4_TIGCA|nr:rhomboid-related protein 1-like [Tigriopus californicus]TRY70827.1 hypothetical protein TCAL_04481 [Tigriopus californicus]|eukprot:TCALIF_04481-PA protein Name:"Similar to RHBDL3 Rhomboid-related protein 3 (Homo sapiens)" AED:0.03 eAED:0.03 QI:0/-1/0/1/-1/1/1/0/444